ncbi:hypothetical protein MIND_00750200 [Mycena indigotica]|uniref:Uncharacterized protein n=1 Tax=Mycena indigotica TaxID=2126181 RepID=A0A8H6W198_9AGAR|nr:uncharacterized protein MIND_00750200 [Mycena indigotica]KAF7301844.1 hypothetical protein MIND_00750200 [Mycena indigotica]
MRVALWALCALPVFAQAALYYPRQNNGTESVSSSSQPSRSSVSSTLPSSKPLPSSSTTTPRSSTTTSSTPVTTTTTTTTSSVISSISSSPASSSVSSIPARSSSSTTPVTLSKPPAIQQAGTIGNKDLATTTENPEDQPSESATTGKVAATSNGFWANKGAVAGTFTVVALVILAILLLFLRTFRHRQESRNSARDTFFDTKSPVVEDHQRYSASIVSLGNDALDPHSAPVPNYGGADHYLVDTNEYNYPPGTTYNNNAAPPQQHYYGAHEQQEPQQDYYAEPVTPNAGHYTDNTAYANAYGGHTDNGAYEAYNQYYSGGQTNTYSVSAPDRGASISPHPYSHPSHTSAAPAAPMRPFAGRDSAFTQQSLDSFYGAAGTAI